MNHNHTDITIVLDRSGSMSSIAADTIGGFNRFLEDQKKAPGTATLTLRQFDTIHDVVIDAKAIHQAKPLTVDTFVPRGMTALLDAIAMAVDATGARLERLPESNRPAKVICVIITDGLENSSHRFTREQVFEKIKHQQDNYQWQFVFLGANQDAIATATHMGIRAANAMTYADNSAGVNAAFASTSSNLVQMRFGSSTTMAYSKEDRKKQKDAGVQ